MIETAHQLPRHKLRALASVCACPLDKKITCRLYEHMKLTVRYFKLEGQRSSPAVDAILALPAKFQAAILSDIEAVAEYQMKAPASIRSMTGHTSLMEIRTGQYRTLFVVDRGELWVLDCCKKQSQRRAIKIANERMKLVLGR